MYWMGIFANGEACEVPQQLSISKYITKELAVVEVVLNFASGLTSNNVKDFFKYT